MKIMQKKTGFTLIELLVVVAIIAVLIAMLLPALKEARDKAKEAQCLSNLKSSGAATLMYALENRDVVSLFRYDTYETWSECLLNKKYLPDYKSLRCPSARPWDDNDLIPGADRSYLRFFTYGSRIENYMYPMASSSGAVRLGFRETSNKVIRTFLTSEIENPSNYIHLVDSATLSDGSAYQNFQLTVTYYYMTNASSSSGGAHFRHSKGCGVWFLDGHAEKASLGRFGRCFKAELPTYSVWGWDEKMSPVVAAW